MSLLRINENDNVALALTRLEAGVEIALPWGGTITTTEVIPASHKIALKTFKTGDEVVRYGQPIARVTVDVPNGGWLHSHNMTDPELQSAKAEAAGMPPQTEGMRGPSEFLGYGRPSGPAGTRNHLLVLPSAACAVGVARAIGRVVPEAVVIEHGYGCGRGGEDFNRTFRLLSGLGLHPNAGAVLMVGLGCETHACGWFRELFEGSGKPVEFIEIQQLGGSQKATAKGLEIAQGLLEKLAAQQRTLQPISDLILGLECGGSDAMSGVTANPAVGCVSDWLAQSGGTAVLAEVTELIGTQHILQRRAANQDVADAIGRIITKNRELSLAALGDNAHLAIAPGNMDGGLSTVMEKSLGCIAKGGGGVINEVVDYAARPGQSGLVIMDTPGYDVESLGGLVGGGCQACFFTTGRGTPVGAPLMPVIKVASNSSLATNMAGDMDINAGLLADGKATMPQMASLLLDELIAVAEGKLTKAEENKQDFLAGSMTAEAL